MTRNAFSPLEVKLFQEARLLLSVYFEVDVFPRSASSLLNLNLSNFKVNGKEDGIILGQHVINDKRV